MNLPHRARSDTLFGVYGATRGRITAHIRDIHRARRRLAANSRHGPRYDLHRPVPDCASTLTWATRRSLYAIKAPHRPHGDLAGTAAWIRHAIGIGRSDRRCSARGAVCSCGSTGGVAGPELRLRPQDRTGSEGALDGDVRLLLHRRALGCLRQRGSLLWRRGVGRVSRCSAVGREWPHRTRDASSQHRNQSASALRSGGDHEVAQRQHAHRSPDDRLGAFKARDLLARDLGLDGRTRAGGEGPRGALEARRRADRPWQRSIASGSQALAGAADQQGCAICSGLYRAGARRHEDELGPRGPVPGGKAPGLRPPDSRRQRQREDPARVCLRAPTPLPARREAHCRSGGRRGDQPVGLVELGRDAGDAGKIEPAIQKYREGLARPRSDAANDRARLDAYGKLLALLQPRNDIQGMEELYKKRATEFGPGSCFSADYARFVLQQRGDADTAVKLAREAVDGQCQDSAARATLGLAHYAAWAGSTDRNARSRCIRRASFCLRGPMSSTCSPGANARRASRSS